MLYRIFVLEMRLWVMLTRFSTLRVSVLEPMWPRPSVRRSERCQWSTYTGAPTQHGHPPPCLRHTWHTPRVTISSNLEYPTCDVMFVTRKRWTLFNSSSLWNKDKCKISTVLPPCHMSECMEHVCISCYQLLILLWLLPSVTQRRGCNEITTATLPHSLNIHSYTTCQLYPLQLIHHDHCTQCSHRM